MSLDYLCVLSGRYFPMLGVSVMSLYQQSLLPNNWRLPNPIDDVCSLLVCLCVMIVSIRVSGRTYQVTKKRNADIASKHHDLPSQGLEISNCLMSIYSSSSSKCPNQERCIFSKVELYFCTAPGSREEEKVCGA